MISIKTIILLGILEILLIELAFEIRDIIKKWKVKRLVDKMLKEGLKEIADESFEKYLNIEGADEGKAEDEQ